MDGNPAQFEVIGSRLGFRVDAESQERLTLVWQATRFPAFLCLGIALGLLFLSVPILEAIRQRGFEGPAGSLWYFPMMNLILLGISLFLFSLKRTILFDQKEQQVVLQKRSILRSARLRVGYEEVKALRLGMDQVYSGFALAGSTAAQKYPVPSLRLILENNETVLLDRGGMRRLESLGKRLSGFLGKPLHTESLPS
ncbi:MAG: hypothetical protein ACREQA_24875 [Candidatus Binatia bacterium]